MAVIEVSRLSYRYGRLEALRGLDLSVPEGAMYALLGPNGAGKSTLLQILAGLRRAQSGTATILGASAGALTARDRQRVSYVAEGQALPGWMRLEQLEAYLAPLYPTWDASLAASLRDRFDLDPRTKIAAMSRGAQMKAALLCALAPRPRVLLMDEPFTGMDAQVKDDLVRGMLDTAITEGPTVLLCSHDIGELEMLADWLGYLELGQLRLSEPMESVRRRFKRVAVVLSRPASESVPTATEDWLGIECAGNTIGFVLDHTDDVPAEIAVRVAFPDATRIEIRDASLRELFVALASRRPAPQGSARMVTS